MRPLRLNARPVAADDQPLQERYRQRHGQPSAAIDRRQHLPVARTAVVGGKLLPRDDDAFAKEGVNAIVAAVPGSYTGPASRAYLYYTDEHKTWVGGLKATITPARR